MRELNSSSWSFWFRHFSARSGPEQNTIQFSKTQHCRRNPLALVCTLFSYGIHLGPVVHTVFSVQGKPDWRPPPWTLALSCMSITVLLHYAWVPWETKQICYPWKLTTEENSACTFFDLNIFLQNYRPFLLSSYGLQLLVKISFP